MGFLQNFDLLMDLNYLFVSLVCLDLISIISLWSLDWASLKFKTQKNSKFLIKKASKIECKEEGKGRLRIEFACNSNQNTHSKCKELKEACERFQLTLEWVRVMMMMRSQMLQVAPLAPHASSSSSSSLCWVQTLPVWLNHCHCHRSRPQLTLRHRRRTTILLLGNPDRKLQVSSSSSSSWTTQQDQNDEEEKDEEDDEEDESDPTPEDLEYISQIKRVCCFHS